MHFYAGAHDFLMLPYLEVALVLLSKFAADLFLVCVVAVLGTLNLGVQTQLGMFLLPLNGHLRTKMMQRYYLMTNNPYSKICVLHLTLLQFSLSCILKNSHRCFPSCSSEKFKFYSIKYLWGDDVCVLTQIQVLLQLLVLGFCFTNMK